MRTRTRGIQLAADGTRTLNQEHKGRRIFRRLGKVSQEQAERELAEARAAIEAELQNELRRGTERLWASGAKKYLMECEQRKVRTLDTIAYHVRILLPYIGSLAMGDVCNEALETFKEDRADDDASNATINRSLEVVRTVMNRAARVWRDEGKPWLPSPPLIEMLDEKATRRPPRPLTWAEQETLVAILPDHLVRPVLFSVNTGARDDNVCGLRWEWERPIPELQRSVFVIPPEEFKGKRPHVLILNDTAWNIVEGERGKHKEFVFVYRRERVKNFDKAPAMEYHRMGTLNNTGWQAARSECKLEKVRIHDLRHTFGQRLRDAGVSAEDRALLLGHVIEDMPQHYATATVARLVEAANKVADTVDRTTLLRVVNG